MSCLFLDLLSRLDKALGEIGVMRDLMRWMEGTHPDANVRRTRAKRIIYAWCAVLSIAALATRFIQC